MFYSSLNVNVTPYNCSLLDKLSQLKQRKGFQFCVPSLYCPLSINTLSVRPKVPSHVDVLPNLKTKSLLNTALASQQ